MGKSDTGVLANDERVDDNGMIMMELQLITAMYHLYGHIFDFNFFCFSFYISCEANNDVIFLIFLFHHFLYIP